MRLKLAAVFTCLALSPARAWDPNKPFIYEMKIAFESDNWTNMYSTATILSKSENSVAFRVVANSTTSPAYQLVVTTQGNVGISTGNPTQKLEVAGTVYSTSGGFKVPDNTTQSSAGIASPSSPQTGDLLYYDGSGWNRLALGSSGQSLKVGSYDSYIKLMLHMDGTNGSTTFTDTAASKSVTANGTAQISTAQSKFGGASGLFDGSSAYLSLADSSDWYFGTGDFTIDFWVNKLSGGTGSEIVFNQDSGSNRQRLFVTSTALSYYIDNGGRQFTFSAGGLTAIDNDGLWHHIALVRSGSSWYWFKDGTMAASSTYSGEVPDFSASLYLCYETDGGGQYYKGYIDEFRVSKGLARWTANFTPPTAAYAPTLTWSN